MCPFGGGGRRHGAHGARRARPKQGPPETEAGRKVSGFVQLKGSFGFNEALSSAQVPQEGHFTCTLAIICRASLQPRAPKN